MSFRGCTTTWGRRGGRGRVRRMSERLWADLWRDLVTALRWTSCSTMRSNSRKSRVAARGFMVLKGIKIWTNTCMHKYIHTQTEYGIWRYLFYHWEEHKNEIDLMVDGAFGRFIFSTYNSLTPLLYNPCVWMFFGQLNYYSSWCLLTANILRIQRWVRSVMLLSAVMSSFFNPIPQPLLFLKNKFVFLRVKALFFWSFMMKYNS